MLLRDFLKVVDKIDSAVIFEIKPGVYNQDQRKCVFSGDLQNIDEYLNSIDFELEILYIGLEFESYVIDVKGGTP